MITPHEIARYDRHTRLPEIGVAGQERLRAASILIIGAGGLGCPAALYLAAAGIGRMGLVDDDRVTLSNLQRQILYTDADVGVAKIDVALQRLHAMNPHLTLTPHTTRLCDDNAHDIVSTYDLVLDGSDNFATKYLLNDVCVQKNIPLIAGGVSRFTGQLSLFHAPLADGTMGPCYRCVYPDEMPTTCTTNCATEGVLGVVPGLIGILQATEAIKHIVGCGESLAGWLVCYDALTAQTRRLKIARDPACGTCGTSRVSRLASRVAEITPQQLHERLQAAAPLQLIDVREPWEFAIAHVPNAQLMPCAQLESQLATLDPQLPTIFYCHHGVRSHGALQMAIRRGFTDATHLAGGIDAWACEIDKKMGRY